MEMRCRIDGHLYRIESISCYSHGILIRVIRSGRSMLLEFGMDYFWVLSEDGTGAANTRASHVRSVKFSPLAKAEIIRLLTVSEDCRKWFKVAETPNDDNENIEPL